MKNQPLTTVVIPAYNAERFIERTLRSALRQTYTNLEIIVVDDGSTDDTRAVAETVAAGDDRVRIFSVPNGGVAKARNIGIEKASGEFVAFLDADDLWHPAKIELQVAALTAGNGGHCAVAVYTLSRIIDADDRIIMNENWMGFSGYTFARHLYYKPVGNGSSMLVRREAALAVRGFDSTYAARGIGGSEDLDFELKIAGAYPTTAIQLYLVGYRTYRGNMTSNRLRSARAMLATVARHLQLHPELPEFAVRMALASTREYAFLTLMVGRHWARAARELALLLRTDVGLGLEAAAKAFKLIIDRLKAEIPGQAPDSGARPMFYHLDPNLDATETLGARRQKIINQLEIVDAVLARKIGVKA